MALAPLNITEDSLFYKQASESPFPVLGDLDELGYETVTEVVAQPEPVAPEVSAEELRMQELERMLQEAQSHAEVIEREAYDKAYAAGEKAGMTLGEKRAEQTLDSLNELLGQAETQLNHLEGLCGEAVLDISRSVLEQVLGTIDEAMQEFLLVAAQRAVLQFPDMSGLTLSVNPDDMQAFEVLLQERDLSDWRLNGDMNLQAGCCRLMSKQQDVLIDPHAAVLAALEQLRIRMQS